MSKTTILVENTTREKLRQIGRKNQTYDELITELIKTKISNGDSLDSRFASLQSGESSGP
jgi:hypothetical protein